MFCLTKRFIDNKPQKIRRVAGGLVFPTDKPKMEKLEKLKNMTEEEIEELFPCKFRLLDRFDDPLYEGYCGDVKSSLLDILHPFEWGKHYHGCKAIEYIENGKSKIYRGT